MDKEERKKKSREYHKKYYIKRKLNNFENMGGHKKIEDKPVDQMTAKELKNYKQRVYMREYRKKNINHIRESQRRWERENRNPGVYRPRATKDQMKFKCEHGKFVITFD